MESWQRTQPWAELCTVHYVIESRHARWLPDKANKGSSPTTTLRAEDWHLGAHRIIDLPRTRPPTMPPETITHIAEQLLPMVVSATTHNWLMH